MNKKIGKLLALLCAGAALLHAPFASADLKLDDKLPVSGKITVGTLANGLTYYIQKNSLPANKAELRLVVRAGSILEDDDQQGLAHFTEHMAFNGTTHFKKHELISFLQSIGVKFGADLNAFTNFDDTIYVLPIPLDRKDNFERGLTILEDWAGGLTFDHDEIERERGVVLEESRRRKGADERMSAASMPKIFEGSAYATRLPIGKDEIIRTFKADALKRFYADWYRPDLMAVIVVGDVDTQEAENMIKAHFSKLKNPVRERPRTYAIIPPRTAPEAVVVTDKEATRNLVNIIYSRKPYAGELTVGDFRGKLVQLLFSAMLGSRVGGMTQRPEPPFLTGGSGVGRLVGQYQQFASSATFGNSYVAAAVNALIQENERTAALGFTVSELDRNRKTLMLAIEHAYNERDKTSSAAHAAAIVRHVLTHDAIAGIETEYAYAQLLLPTITLDELNSYARQTIAGDNLLLVYHGVAQAGVLTPSGADLLAMVAKARANRIRVNYGNDKGLAGALMAAPPKGGSIVSETVDPVLGLTELTLGNGVKVVLKRTDFQNDQVLMGAARAGGNSLYADSERYNVAYAPALVSAMGIGEFSASDIRKILAGKSASVTPFIDNIREGLGGRSGSQDVEAMLQLTYLHFTQPRKDSPMFASFVVKGKESTKNVLARPEILFQASITKALYGDHPRAPRIATPFDYDQLDLDRALTIYRERFASARDYTFFFVGSFDMAAIKPMAAAYLGALPTGGAPAAFKDVAPRPVRGVVKKQEYVGVEQKSAISITFSGATAYSVDAQMRMAALLEVVRIKFNDRLRGVLGAVYSVGVTGGVSKAPYGNYTIALSIPCSPDNVDKLIAAALAEIQKLKADGAVPSDLVKVKEAWTKTHQESMKSNTYWLRNLSGNREAGEDPARILSYDARVAALTPADVKQAANAYFDLDNYVQVVLYPAKK